jgi:hypothetical protein
MVQSGAPNGIGGRRDGSRGVGTGHEHAPEQENSDFDGSGSAVAFSWV